MATITLRGGKYHARIRIKGYPSVSCSFHDKRAAHIWAVQTEDAIRRGVFTFEVTTCPPLRKVVDAYLKSRAFKGKRGADIERYFFEGVKDLRIAARPLDQITVANFTALRDEWAEKVTPSTISRRFTMLKALYSFAAGDLRLAVENIPAQVRLAEFNDSRTRRPTQQEVLAICQATDSATLPIIVHLAIETAMRRGEILSLRIEHIDLVNGTALLPTTKNGDARVVPLTPKAKTILADAIGQRKHGPLFNEKAGSISQAWRRAVIRARARYEAESKEAGIEPSPTFLMDLRLHDARHEAISRLIEGGFSTIEASQVSGHRTLSMLQRYANLHSQHLVDKLARLEAATP